MTWRAGYVRCNLLLVYVRVILLDLLDDGSKGRSRLELRNIQTSVMPLRPFGLVTLTSSTAFPSTDAVAIDDPPARHRIRALSGPSSPCHFSFGPRGSSVSGRHCPRMSWSAPVARNDPAGTSSVTLSPSFSTA
jgi:hypothetical protein